MTSKLPSNSKSITYIPVNRSNHRQLVRERGLSQGHHSEGIEVKKKKGKKNDKVAILILSWLYQSPIPIGH